MSHCFNPTCSQPQNTDGIRLCSSCKSDLLLLDRYHATQIIGQGGFGKTYLAINKKSNSPCVIKQFSFPSSSSTALRLFSDEAGQLQSLGVHEQIPTFIDYVEQQDECFIVQEFVDGSNLEAELADSGAFTETQVEQLLLDILPVIEFIHKQGVIHRDIKPENLIHRKSDGKFVLVDFGAAKQATTTALAKTGTTIGSAGYTAPEQAFGKAVKQSDLYSLGVTSIHLLTNMHPFDLVDSSDGNWVWRDYLKQPVNQRLGKIIDKLLERGTKMRYASAAEVLQDLKAEVRKKPDKKSTLRFPFFEETVTVLVVLGLISGAAMMINNINNALNSPTAKKATQVLTSMQDTKFMPVQSVEVWNEPLLISFDKNKETIAKAWLDDPTKIAIALDKKTGVINLQKLSKAFKPGATMNLTVITQSISKKKIQYRFRVVAGIGKSKYKEVKIIDGEVEIQSIITDSQVSEQRKNESREIEDIFLLLINASKVLAFLTILLGMFKSIVDTANRESSIPGLVSISFGMILLILINSLEPTITESIASIAKEKIHQAKEVTTP